MNTSIGSPALDQLFDNARTFNVWQDTPVKNSVLVELYDRMKMGPTSANCCPARFIFVKSNQAKEKLKPCLAEGNVEKVMMAPVTVIIGQDLDFASRLPKLFPHAPDASTWFEDPSVRDETAFRNSTLQGAYLMLAARALGLDCGPMSGFDKDGVDKAFFKDTKIKSNFICSLGYGSDKDLFPRSPRFDFDEIATIV